MAGSALFFVLAILVCGNANRIGSRIIGGGIAPKGFAPFAVGLRIGKDADTPHCTGTLITPKFVLTAAKCIDGVFIPSSGTVTNELKIVSGTQNFKIGGLKNAVRRNFTHPEWDSVKLINDIGLLELVDELQLDSDTDVIARNYDFIGGSNEVTVVGWGWDVVPGSSINELKYLNTITLTEEDCSKRIKEVNPDAIISKEHICTLKSEGQALCKGDTGGPLYNEDGVLGIVSWIVPCAMGVPDVYTRLSIYNSWIEDVISKALLD